MTNPDPQYVALMGEIVEAGESGASAETVGALLDQMHARYLDLVRGASTGDGYPYPDPTDPLAEGADAIRALAEALSYRTLTEIKTGSITAAQPPG